MPARSRLIALLALDLELARIPRSVSEPLLGQLRLQWWREAVAAARRGGAPAHPVAQALAETGAAGVFSEAGMAALFSAHESVSDSFEDVGKRGAAQAALALDVLRIDDEPTRLAARHVGSAWALVAAMQRHSLSEAMAPAAAHLAAAAALPTLRVARPALLPGVLAKAYLRRPRARLTPLGRQLRLMIAYARG